MSLPLATYRLQLTKDFTLQDAAGIAPYLASLGVSHVYLSPICQSSQGSTHGYDGTDFAAVSEERGGEEGLALLDKTLRQLGLKMILDVVPNHMASSPANPYIYDCLRHGRESRYWRLFDWRVPEGGKIELPILGDDLEGVVAKGDLKRDGDTLAYFDTVLPLAPGSEDITDMQALLEAQHYRLAKWTSVFETLHYRRFFDITGLIGLRVEDEDVYREVHQSLLAWAKRYPGIDGFRIDHIDGLSDPGGYLNRLRRDIADIWVEKILARDETLPQDWPVHGTTGYEFIDRLHGILVNPGGLAAINRQWQDIQPRWPDFRTCVREAKAYILDLLFPVELKRLETLSGIPAADWKALCVALPVYRTYGTPMLNTTDQDRIRKAASPALADMLLNPKTAQQVQALREWQQLSGPAMAKGLEDCAHYRFHPLSGLNDVGCEAEPPQGDIAAFFDWLNAQDRMLKATTTHDTKRSEDVRARLYALADMPEDWAACYKGFADLTGNAAMSGPTRWLLLQTLLGTWPLNGAVDKTYKERIADYMLKAAREARLETSWLEPDEAYEKSLRNFVMTTLDHDGVRSLVGALAARIAPAGIINSLTALTLKILSPGIPDIYQGCEDWAFSLVDPDNRRPVDYAALREGGSIKQTLTRALLALRKEHEVGPVTPVDTGNRHIIAYRMGGLLICLPRYTGGFARDDLSLALPGDLRLDQPRLDLLTGQYVTEALTAQNLFAEFPVRVFAA